MRDTFFVFNPAKSYLVIFLVCLCNKVLIAHRDNRRHLILRLHTDMLKCSSVCGYKENAIGFGQVTTWLDSEKVLSGFINPALFIIVQRTILRPWFILV